VAADLNNHLLRRVLAFYTLFTRQPRVGQPEVWSKIGMAYWRIGDIHRQLGQLEQCYAAYDAACRSWRQAASEKPTVYDYQYQVAKGYGWTAQAFWEMGQYQRAVEYFTQYLEFVGSQASLRSNAPPVFWRRGQAYEALKQYDRAIEDYTKAIQAGQDAHHLRAAARFQQGDYRGAIQDCTETLHRHPDWGDVWRFRAEAYARMAEWDKAIADASKAIELNPKEGMYWNTLGVAQYRAGQYKDAVASLTKAMEFRSGGDAFDWFFMAMAHGQLKNQQEARQWYHKAVAWMEKNKPDDEELLGFRAEAEQLLGIAAKSPAGK